VFAAFPASFPYFLGLSFACHSDLLAIGMQAVSAAAAASSSSAS